MTRLASMMICFAFGTGIVGGPVVRHAAAETPIPQAWSERLADIESQLQQNQWEAARRQAQAITEQLVEQSGGTEGDKRAFADDLGGSTASPDRRAEAVVLGRAAAYRAIAEATSERRDEARWHWYLAQNLLGDVSAIGLARYRKSAAVLQRHVLAEARRQYAGMPDVLDPVRPEETYGHKFKEPVRTRVVYPYLPRDLRRRDRFSHVVFVQITLDAKGEVSQPVVVDGAFYPGLIARAFDALREWRYQPAMMDGRPVPFRYIVPVAFADDRKVLPLAEWDAPAPSLGIVPTGYTLNHVGGLAADLHGGALYVVDRIDSRVLRVDPRGGTTRFAGAGTAGFNGEEAAALEAQLDHPSAVSYDPRTGELFIADTRNYRIRVVSPKAAQLRTVAGVGLRDVSRRVVPYEAHTAEALSVGRFGGDGGPATAADLNLPSGICADPTGILFVADSGNHRIRAINRGTSPVIVMGVEIAPGHIQTVAGMGTPGFSGDGGKAAQAQFAFPAEIKIDGAGNLLVLDSFNQRLRRIDRQSGIVRTVARGAVTDVTSANAAEHWSISLVAFAIAPNQDIVYADRGDGTVRRLTRGGDNEVIYKAQAHDGDFTDVEVGALGEIYIAEKRRIGVLRLENQSTLTYLTAASKPLPKP